MERLLSLLLVASTTTARKLVVLDNNEWDSVVVTTSPVKITNSRFNQKNQTKPNSVNFETTNHARMLSDCDERDIKCLYDSQLHQKVPQTPKETVDKFLEKFSGVTNVKINEELRNETPKAYWTDPRPQSPFDDQKGWVTLEPIPWSESKVSKWKPNYKGDRPWNVYDSQARPTSSLLWVSNNFPESNPPPPSWGHNANEIMTDNRPPGFPMDGPGYPNRPSYHPQPAPPSVVYQTANTPHYGPPSHYTPQNSVEYSPVNLYQPPVPKPQPSSPPQPIYNYAPSKPSAYQWQQHQHHQQQSSSSNGYQSSHAVPAIPVPEASEGRPSTYPETGQGEWVLLSTTKGYSVPQRYHDRKMEVTHALSSQPAKPDIISRSINSKYEEKDIDDKFMTLPGPAVEGNRKSDSGFERRVLWNVDGINILQQRQQKSTWNDPEPEENTEITPMGPPVHEEPKNDAVFKRTVRLTVLPPINNTSILSHGGMLEIDSNLQSVEEAQRHEERLKKLQQLAIVNNQQQQQQFRVVNVPRATSGKDVSKKRAAVLAALGAGMIPATMAVMLPLALGRRRRRSLQEEHQSHRIILPRPLIR